MFWSTKNKTNNVSTTTSNASGAASIVVITAGGGGGGGTSAGVSIVNPINGSYGTISASGSSGAYLTTGGWTAMSSTTTASGTVSMTGNLTLSGSDPHIITNKNKLDIDKLCRNLEIVNEMFRIIVPDFDELERNPTLMDAFIQYDHAKHIEPRYGSEEYIAAYEQYKLLEALTHEQS